MTDVSTMSAEQHGDLCSHTHMRRFKDDQDEKDGKGQDV